jgi:uncharacterized protein YprB with RNaseH-like and TPR domain
MNHGFTCFDIEATDLKANWGHILVACFLSLDGGDPVVFRLDDRALKNRRNLFDDRKLVVAVRDFLEDSFCWITWNGKMYDIPFLQTRLAMKDERPLTHRMHLDLMYYARRPNLALHSTRLEVLVDTFKVGEKTHMKPDVWEAAQRLDKEAMDYVVDHCTKDVESLKGLFPILSPFVKNIHY